MRHGIYFGLAAIFLSLTAFASAQNVPAVDIFGGYSYLDLQIPASGETSSQTFKMNGYDASLAIALFHHLSVEADFSGHRLSDCDGISNLNCDDFSYMVGPRYTFGDHSSKVTIFVHGLVGRDKADIIGLDPELTVSDTSIGIAGGAGLDYWFMRHIGVQLGPIDAFYTNHLSDLGASGQVTYRAAVGVVFRFGGDLPPAKPKPPQEAKVEKPAQPEKPESHRSWIRPWHKTVTAPAEGQTTTTATAAPVPSTPAIPSRGMPIHSIGLVVAPQEFDGARILAVDPGSVAEMASFHVGDLIKAVDGKPVKTPMELAAELSDKTGKVSITIQRGTAAIETVILLGAH
jgi:hypothetical protein